MDSSTWETLRWEGGTDGQLILLDQTRLPLEACELRCTTLEDVWNAIKCLSVRGAPAIGIAAAYGLVIGMREAARDVATPASEAIDQVIDYLCASRPTAVNLAWALERLRTRVTPLLSQRRPTSEILAALLREAEQLHEEDRATCRAIGSHGAQLLQDGMGVLTHCNAGALAASQYGTALSVIYAAHDAGKQLRVYADETRPLLQGARLTAWELTQHGVDTTLICDSMAAQVMREGRVDAVITGADRIAANGDVANKIGTYGLALLARAHNLPFYVAAPVSTFDLSLADGSGIPIEQRSAEEITCGMGRQTAPSGIQVYNPAFDVTPAELISALITERGVITPVTRAEIVKSI